MADTNKQLMIEQGSKNGSYDPESPDWWLYSLNHSNDPIARLISYLKSKTVARGYHSPYAIDEKSRKPITLARIAIDLDWHIENARKYLDEAIEKGLVRVEEVPGRGGSNVVKIWLCADVPAARQPRQKEPKPQPKLGEQTSNLSSLYRLSSPCMHQQIQQLPKAVQEKMEIASLAAFEWGFDHLETDAMAAAREMQDRIENSILAIGGLKKEDGRTPPADGRLRLVKQLTLAVDLPEFVSQSVQTGKVPLYRGNGSPVQGKNGGASLYTDSDSNKTLESSSDLVEVRREEKPEPFTEPTTTKTENHRNGRTHSPPSPSDFSDPLKFLASYESPRDALTAMMNISMGFMPDGDVVRIISELVEMRGGKLDDYIVDSIPRIGRLKERPHPGFFMDRAKKWGRAAPAAEPKKVAAACSCKGSGRAPDGSYCTCSMGRDLRKVEARAKKAEAVT